MANELEILRTLAKRQIKKSALSLQDIGPDLRNIAAEIGLDPTEVKNVIVPLIKEVFEEVLSESDLQRTMADDYRRQGL